MHFRDAKPADIPHIVGSLSGANALPCSPRLRRALPELLRILLPNVSSPVTIFEGELPAGVRFFSWAATLFVRSEVIEAYLVAPRPCLAAAILESMLDGEHPLMSFDELRRANSGAGVHLVLVPTPHGELPWNHPALDQLRRLTPLAFISTVGGYRVAAVYYEVYDEDAASYVQQGGFRLLHDFSHMSSPGFISPEAKPRMMRLVRGDLPPGAMSFANHLFDPPRPRLGLSPAEQRVALKALGGAPDRSIAELLGISLETVRSHWSSVYARLAVALPELGVPGGSGKVSTRGPEHRRIALEYLRQQIHELRPHC